MATEGYSGAKPGTLLNASPEGQAGLAAYGSDDYAVLSLNASVPGTLLSTWFKGHPNWRSGPQWDALKAVKLRDLPKGCRRAVISYRHEKTNAMWDCKYLPHNALSVLEGLVKHSGHLALEGLWIDALCIAPIGHTLTFAFGYMGRLYLDCEVHLCWLAQGNIESLSRGWIFQECQRTVLSDYSMSLVRGLTNPYIEGQLTLMRTQDVRETLSPLRASYPTSSTMEDVAVCLMHLPFLSVDVESDRAVAILGSLEAQHGSRLASYSFADRRFVRITSTEAVLNRRLELGVKKRGGGGYATFPYHSDARKLFSVVVFDDHGPGVWSMNVVLQTDRAVSYFDLRDYILGACAAKGPMFALSSA